MSTLDIILNIGQYSVGISKKGKKEKKEKMNTLDIILNIGHDGVGVS